MRPHPVTQYHTAIRQAEAVVVNRKISISQNNLEQAVELADGRIPPIVRAAKGRSPG